MEVNMREGQGTLEQVGRAENHEFTGMQSWSKAKVKYNKLFKILS